MLLVESALEGYAVDANDGSIGRVHDCLLIREAGRCGGWSLTPVVG
jgi:hypothetical protein